MLKKNIILISTLYGIALASSLWLYNQKPLLMEDVGQLLPTKIKEVHSATSEAELQRWVKESISNHEKISVAGMQHSQGGHTYYPNGIVINMKNYNKILDYNPDEQTITVQSGATWDDIQKEINPDNLAIRVMQSQNIFTVGGSISINAHGRDIRYGSLIDTVESFRLLTPEGDIKNVSRTENSELFPLVIGGYGLFGIILDVTLHLTNDELYQIRSRSIDYEDYPDYFVQEVKENEAIRMHIARLSVAPDTLLKGMYVTDYELVDHQETLAKYATLKRDTLAAPQKFMLGLSRYSDWGKNLLWELQSKVYVGQDGNYITRNNAMRGDSKFMEYDNPSKTEILQEYFVPIDEFTSYLDDLRIVLENEELNLLNITVRYVNKDEEAVLSYAKEDMFALVLLINQGKSKEDIQKTEKIIQKMIDVTLEHDGSYYLPYYSYPTQAQMDEAYPRNKEFFEQKKKYDPDELFMNLFYKEYSQ
ncbi:FAD-binding oxidoreductase [Ornithinibacillus californiensis]|uniref:FAD-binding oxidoreductase n=1 Tax=Ornithinibacillus californiensis TaxID=161536 RepID=UPI00064D840C|nr:FAD-binding oxidoreductase [Ornithinibacillus californiensis]